MRPTPAISGTEIAAHVHQHYQNPCDDRTHSTASETPDRVEPFTISQCQEPSRVAAGRDARGEKSRVGEARRNARVGGPHRVQADHARHQAHTARHPSLQADPTAASQLATLLVGPSQLDSIVTNHGNQVNSSIGQDYAWSRPAKAKG